MNLEYNITKASDLSGVGVHTLRAWERRYGAVTPNRPNGNDRRYSEDEVKKLKILNNLTQKGYAISAIANLSIDKLEKLCASSSVKDQIERIEELEKAIGFAVNKLNKCTSNDPGMILAYSKLRAVLNLGER